MRQKWLGKPRQKEGQYSILRSRRAFLLSPIYYLAAAPLTACVAAPLIHFLTPKKSVCETKDGASPGICPFEGTSLKSGLVETPPG